MAKNSKTGINIPCYADGKQNPAYYEAYYTLNRERILKHNRENRDDGRYRHLRGNQDYKKMLIEVLIQRDGEDCGICGRPLTNISIDHKIPVCRGGSPYTADNLQLAHLKCNLKKRRNGDG